MTTETATQIPGSLFEALARFQADLPKILKGETAKVDGKEGKQGYKYKYADLDDVSQVVLRHIGALGMSFISKPTTGSDGKFGLAYSLVHVSGEREDGFFPLRSDLAPQQIGGLITYARRYCLCAVTGAAPAGDDDDASAAQSMTRQAAGDAFDSAGQQRRGANQGPRQEANGRSGSDFDNAAPASPQSGRQDDQQLPAPLEPRDPWSPAIEAIHTVEDAETAEKELRRAYLADEINSDRASQVKHWIRVKAAPMRSAAKSAAQRDTGKPADPPTDEGWVADYMARLNAAELDGLPTRGEIGQAVAARKITPEDGAALSAEWLKRKRQLEDAARQPEASAA